MIRAGAREGLDFSRSKGERAPVRVLYKRKGRLMWTWVDKDAPAGGKGSYAWDRTLKPAKWAGPSGQAWVRGRWMKLVTTDTQKALLQKMVRSCCVVEKKIVDECNAVTLAKGWELHRGVWRVPAGTVVKEMETVTAALVGAGYKETDLYWIAVERKAAGAWAHVVESVRNGNRYRKLGWDAGEGLPACCVVRLGVGIRYGRVLSGAGQAGEAFWWDSGVFGKFATLGAADWVAERFEDAQHC